MIRKRTKKLLVQFLEYFVGGNVFFYSGYAVFSLCYSVFRWHWWLAKLLADVIGWTLNYIVQRYWAFKKKSLYGHEEVNRGRYVLISAIDTVLDYGIVGGGVGLGMSPYFGMLAAAGFFTIWNYMWYRFWVFR